MISPEGMQIPEAAKKEFDIGSREFVAGNNDTAIGHFVKALEISPEFHDANYMLALAQLRSGDSESAIVSLNKVADNSSNVMLREYAQMKLQSLAE